MRRTGTGSLNLDHHRSQRSLLRPPDKKFWRKVRDTIWDSEKKQCLHRTPKNWLSVLIYYVIFLCCVGLVFYLYLTLAVLMPAKDQPQYLYSESLIGDSPSLNFFPLVGDYPLVWVSSSHSHDEYVNSISKEFSKYKKANGSFDPSIYGECGQPPYGYDKKEPCIYFRINRIIKWIPVPYTKGDKFPSDMPEEIKELINNASSPHVWLSCGGTMPKDRDYLKDEFFIFPAGQGFDISVFPFDRQKTFVDPIVALKLSLLNATKIILSFTCVAWGKGGNPQSSRSDIIYYVD